MANENLILDKLTEIANKLDEQVPHFCPQGKKLYFRRDELDIWLQRNRQSAEEPDQDAADLVIRSRKS